MKICILDLETTGLDVENDNIIELAAARVDTDTWTIEERVSAFIREDDYEPLTEEITEITGITDHMLRKSSSRLQVVWMDFSIVMAGVKYFLAHNVGFDKPMLINNLRRRSIDPGLVERAPWVCTVSDIEHPRKITSRKLAHMALDYGVVVDPNILHRAVNDVELTVAMLKARGRDWEDDINYVNTPNVVYAAQICPPWEDGGVQKAQAMKLGFRWNPNNKTWSATFKEGHEFPDVAFPIKEMPNG